MKFYLALFCICFNSVFFVQTLADESAYLVQREYVRPNTFPPSGRIGVDIPMVECNEPSCDGSLAPIFCGGPIVSALWYFGLYHSCMDVFRRMNYSPAEIMANFTKLISDDMVLKRDDVKQFCDENFSREIFHIQPANLSDWTSAGPKNFDKINNAKMKKFAVRLNQIWPELAREFTDAISKFPNQFKVATVKRPFIVPGGFFQYYFYWDSFWVLRGLYFSGMLHTARGMLENFGDIIREKGYIPNSATIEHSRRSQPPYFVPMIADHYEATGDRRFLAKFLPLAESEFDWWMRNRSVQVTSPNGQKTFTMFQFKSVANCPRAEMFGEDYLLGKNLGSLKQAHTYWTSSAGVCESGMDFTSRWYSDYGANDSIGKGLTDLLDVVPVDLNTLIAMNYQTVADLYGILGDKKKSTKYASKAAALREAVHEVMYDGAGTGVWFDWDVRKRAQRRRGFYPSNIFPLTLLAHLFPDADARKRQCARVVDYLDREGVLSMPGGVPSSMEKRANEQWDYPNEWAPLTHIFVASLMNCHGSSDAAVAAAVHAADGYLRTSYNGLFNPPRNQPAQMWEKYDARFDDGTVGFGGEYPAQSGFGWSNGAALDLIRMFYTDEMRGHGLLGLMPVVANNYPVDKKRF